MNLSSDIANLSSNEKNEENNDKKNRTNHWRNLIAYWILGLCNNYGYVVMLSAAHDILKDLGDSSDHSTDTPLDPSQRICNKISTGAILLADIIPSLCVKIIAPFIPLWVNVRISICVLLASAGFILVAIATAEWIAILGVICTSFSSGLGEATFLMYSASYDKNVISTWSSGTGGAGIAGSLSYASLIQLGLSPVATLLIMLVIPALEALTFWVILTKPDAIDSSLEVIKTTNISYENPAMNKTEEENVVKENKSTELDQSNETEEELTFKDKMQYLPYLLKFIIPLTTVYLFEYFINQGLFELIYFTGINLDHSSQYRWLQVDYQIGVFISRSSVNILQVDKVWIMSALQLANVFYFLFEALYFFTPSIYIIFALVLWEGLLGGGAYVNTFYSISKNVSPESKKQFALAATAISDSFGIALAGAFAIPAHNAICELPAPIR